MVNITGKNESVVEEVKENWNRYQEIDDEIKLTSLNEHYYG